METQPIKLSFETKALLEQLIRERDAAVQRLDVALLATRAAQGVPADWQIRNLDEGFAPAYVEGEKAN
jgi:hypothetical protein